MSHPSVSGSAQPQAPATPQPGFLRSTWNNTKWAAWTATHPFAAATSAIQSGTQTAGGGLLAGAKKEIEQMVQPDGPLGIQLKQTLELALLQQPPKQILELKNLLDKAVKTPATLNGNELLAIRNHMRLLSADDHELLKKMAPDLPHEAMDLCDSVFESFLAIEDGIIHDAGEIAANITHLQDESFQQLLTDFNQLFTEILRRNQGALNQALAQLQTALFSEEGGILTQAVEVLKNKCLDENTGLMKQGVDQLTSLLTKEGGSIDTLSNKLSTILQNNVNTVQEQLLREGGTIDQAVNHAVKLLQHKLQETMTAVLGQLVSVQDLLLRENGIVDQTVDRAVRMLQQKLMAKDGPVDIMDHRFTAHAHPLLSRSRSAMLSLRLAVIDNNKLQIEQHSKALENLLPMLESQRAAVFPHIPLHADDLARLQQLKNQLASFYAQTPPSQDGMLTFVETGIQALNTYYGSYAGIAERTGDIFCDKIAEAVGPLMSRVENLPRTMVGNLFGGAPAAAQPPALPPPPADPSQPQEGTISQFLSQGGSILNSLLSSGGEAVSKKTLFYFASALRMGVQQVIDKMDNSDPFLQVKKALVALTTQLDNLVSHGGDWHGLKSQIQAASLAVQGIKIYVSGFRVPMIGSTPRPKNAEIAFADNLDALKKALDAPVAQPENPKWKEMAVAEQAKLVNNTTQFLTISYLFEKICHLRPTDEQFYLVMMRDANKESDSAKALKRLFFAALSEKKVGSFIRFKAHIAYYLCEKLLNHWIANGTTTYFKDIFKYIEGLNANKFDPLRNMLLNNSTRYLSILGGAYNKVAKDPNTTGTLKEMLMNEMEKKESNMGFETGELYKRLVHDILKKSMHPVFYWIARLFMSNPEAIVRSIVDKTVGSLEDTHGYTHALNTVIREQLDEILKLLRADLARGNRSENPDDPQDLSQSKKDQLSGLLKNLFEVLRKSNCGTISELRDLIEGKLLSTKVHSAIDNLFMEEILEKAMTILAVTIQSLVKAEQLEKLTYTFASLVNRSFEAKKEEIDTGKKKNEEQSSASVEARQFEERQIALRSEQILRLAIGTSVRDKFDFSGKPQQEETNRFISQLHEESTAWFTETKRDLSELGDLEITSPEGRNKVGKIMEAAKAWQSKCSESSFKSKSTQISSDNKDEIGKRFQEMAERSQPFVAALVQLKTHATSLENLGSATPHLEQILRNSSTIGHQLSHGELTLEKMDEADRQLVLLQGHLEDLKKMGLKKEGHFALVELHKHAVAQILVTVRRALHTRTLGTTLTQPNSLLDQITAEKTQALSTHTESPSLANKCAELEAELLRSVAPERLPQLLRTLKDLKGATHPEQITPNRQEFLRLIGEATVQATETIARERQNYLTQYEGINSIIQQTELLKPATKEKDLKSVQDSIAQAKTLLNDLAGWDAAKEAANTPQVPFSSIRQIPFINLELIDLKGIQDWAGELIYNRVKERQKGLMNFIRQPETYRYGLGNHLILLPYIQWLKSGGK